MPYRTDKEIKERKAAGVKMKRLNCGWNIAPAEIAEITRFIDSWEPITETEKRDKHILELAFIQNMNASQIARLNDPVIVGIGNRNKGKPLTPEWIVKICHKYAPATAKRQTAQPKNKKQRDSLYKARQRGEIVRQETCATCGSRDSIELHHIIPIAAGGTNDYFNMISLCHDCHMKLHHNIYNAVKWKISISNNIE